VAAGFSAPSNRVDPYGLGAVAKCTCSQTVLSSSHPAPFSCRRAKLTWPTVTLTRDQTATFPGPCPDPIGAGTDVLALVAGRAVRGGSDLESRDALFTPQHPSAVVSSLGSTG
jgi:hypothetical protein